MLRREAVGLNREPDQRPRDSKRPMTQKVVSVIIPVYNGSKYVKRAIDSVLAQTYKAIELVVVDDGSTDGSREVISAYGARVVPIFQQNNGVAHARNAGIRHSSGEFVAFLDQDDWWADQKIEKQVRAISAEVDLVHTGVSHYDECSGQFVEPLNPQARPDKLVGECYEQLLLGNAIYNSSVMVRRSALDLVGLFDTEIRGNTVQDYELWLRIARRGRLAYVGEEMTVFRVHADQGTWNRTLMLSEEIRLLERQSNTNPGTLRRRLAVLWEQLGIAYLDARETSEARRCFGKSVRMQLFTRAAALCVASYLPQWFIDKLRRTSAP